MHQAIGKYRWTICALVFFATTINYLDRQVISLVKDTFDEEFKWTKSDYANITVAFQLAYALGLFGAGRLIDKLGTKIGYALSLIVMEYCCHVPWIYKNNDVVFSSARAALGSYRSRQFSGSHKSSSRMVSKKRESVCNRHF